MSDYVELPDLQDYVSIKDAAKILGLAYNTVNEYVREGRIKAVRAVDVILIPIEEVRNFKSNVSGRPRTSVPFWRISPENNLLRHTSIFVKMREGKLDLFLRRLEDIRQKKKHIFPGTIHRYIFGSDKKPDQVEITLIWRSTVMPDEASRETALEAFRQELADVLDWDTAQYDDGSIFMHA